MHIWEQSIYMSESCLLELWRRYDQFVCMHKLPAGYKYVLPVWPVYLYLEKYRSWESCMLHVREQGSIFICLLLRTAFIFKSEFDLIRISFILTRDLVRYYILAQQNVHVCSINTVLRVRNICVDPWSQLRPAGCGCGSKACMQRYVSSTESGRRSTAWKVWFG